MSGVGVDVVMAELQRLEGVVGEAHLDAFAVAKPAHGKADPSPDNRDLDRPIIQFADFYLTVGRQIYRIGTDLDLGA